MKKDISREKLQTSKLILICLLLIAAILIAFEPVRHNTFVRYDDDIYITENPYVQQGLTTQSIKWAFTTGHAANWHPLTWLSHMLDYQFFGDNPFYHHQTNVFLHIINSILLLVILKKSTNALWASVFVAAVFALHPLRVESVAWAAERKDVLSGFFWLLTLAAYFWYAKKISILKYLAVFLLLALGLMAKPMLVSLPFILLLFDYWPLERFDLTISDVKTKVPKLIAEKLPLLLLVIFSMVVTFVVQQKAGAMMPGANYTLSVRISNAIVAYVAYMGKMLLPYHLAVLYPHPGDTLDLWKPIVSLLLLLLITLWVLYYAKKYRFLVVGWLWYRISLIPVIGMVQVGEQSMADRYTYISSIGFFIALIWLFAEIQKKYKQITIPIKTFAVIIIVVMIIATRGQASYWKNDITLFSRTIEVTDKNYIIHNNLGFTMFSNGQFDKALGLFDKALGFKPDYAKACNNKARVYLTIGKFDKAAECLRKTIKMAPYWPDAYNNLGLAHFLLGDYTKARHNYQIAFDLKPQFPKALNGLGKSLLKLEKTPQAIVAFDKAIELKPDYADPYYFGAIALAKLDKVPQSVEYLRKSISYNPDWFAPVNTLAWFLAVSSDPSVNNPHQAVILAKRACQLSNNKHCNCFDTLAAAYAALGDFENAILIAQKALELAKKYNDQPQIKNITEHLKLFKKHKAITTE